VPVTLQGGGGWGDPIAITTVLVAPATANTKPDRASATRNPARLLSFIPGG